MKNYVLSPRAQADIEEIWAYTVEHWGEGQAVDYLRLLKNAIETLASSPHLGRACDYIRAGYHKYGAG